MRHNAKLLLVILLLFVFNLKQWAQTPYRQYANDGIELNFFDIENVDFRAYLLYNLAQDNRFAFIVEDENGVFTLTSNDDLSREDFFESFEDFYNSTFTDFQLLSKNDIFDLYPIWKSQVDPRSFASIMMDITLRNTRSDNESCINAEPFCTTDFYSFEAASTSNTANEPNMDDGCIGSSYNPSWYYLRIGSNGQFAIHMEGVDPDNPNTHRDIDFCMWGPYTEQEVNSGSACSNLTAAKIVDCCYSASYSEDAYLGYPEGSHGHSHGTIHTQTPQVGEYYILMITNFSRQPCIIDFHKDPEGDPGTTDCAILPPIVDNYGPYCVGDNIELHAHAASGADYFWTGPGITFFNEMDPNPTILNCTMDMAGVYECTISKGNQTASSTTTVVIYPNPVAGFTGATNTCVGTPIEFASTSTTNPSGYDISDYLWDFDDGQTSSVATTTHTFDQSGTYHVMLHVSTGNGVCTDEITQTIIVSEDETGEYETSVCDNEFPYVFHGVTFTSAETQTVTLEGVTELGCDSILTLTVSTSPALTGTYETSVCESQFPFTFHGETFTSAGTRTVTHVGVTEQGCDSTLTLTVNANPALTGTYSATVCETQIPFTFHGVTFNSTGTQTLTIPNATPQGCDSIVTLSVTVNGILEGEYNATVCESQLPFTFHGVTFDAAGSETLTIPNATPQGCDSIVTLNVEVNGILEGEYNATVCESQLPFTFHGITFTQSGQETLTIPNATPQGCDSIVTLNVTVNGVLEGNYSASVCDSQLPYTFHGITFTSAGTQTITIPNATPQGCDSIVTLSVTVSEVLSGEYSATICDDQLPYTFHGTTFTAGGTQTFTIPNATPQGCDSIVTLNLTVNNGQEIELTEQAYNSYTWHGETYFESGDYTFDTLTAEGCNRHEILHLTIDNEVVTNEIYETACDNFYWEANNETYNVTGNYTAHFPSQHDGDSIVMLHLTINLSETENYDVTECDSYTWHGQTYTTGGDYTFDTLTAQGCDRHETLHLTLGHSDESHINITSCESYVWYGTSYTESGTYEHREQTAEGCEILEVLHLNIGTNFLSEETQASCDSYSWRNHVYTESGTYNVTVPNPDGCDSTFVLNLTINPSLTTEVVELACREFEWFGTIYNESGVYNHVEQSTTTGCDSTIVLRLTIEDGALSPNSIHGQSQVYPATNLIHGVYTYHIDSTNIDPSLLRWSISRDDWQITPHRATCKVLCLTEGEARLRAWTEGDFCDIDTSMMIYSSFFDVNENGDATLSIYPNPSRGEVTVSWRDIEEVHVIDILGQRLASYKFGKVESCEINIGTLAHGVYVLEIVSTDGKAYRPVVRGD